MKNYLLDKENETNEIIEVIGGAIANRFARDGGFCGQKAGEEFAYDIRKYLEESGFRIVKSPDAAQS